MFIDYVNHWAQLHSSKSPINPPKHPFAMTASRTNLGPLTTRFTWSDVCTTTLFVSGVFQQGFLAQTCVSCAPQDAPNCWPSPTSDVPMHIPLSGLGLYSPGLLCPKGFTSACSSTAGVSGGFGFQFPLTAQETAVGCCLRCVMTYIRESFITVKLRRFAIMKWICMYQL